ncbi:hypothetical protein XENTR_v10006769 [Xenopus tropicalis]|nr:E3 ubiquitin-protein ligase TRIM39 [Xenopus tropicalis]KAE8626816.1 hypothetical protein XENTR_v10006769 [Xenopus tropicalis]KAE8626817.1 hypothetical protein XENTR_v10006769 [Xenopus tropicalis]KAE8626818.1 hypothetical protein XENTR_v10006769 [Xenopus tropicalis]
MATANRNPVTELKEELTCPICLDHFSEPVSIECGHSFCRACITRTWRGIHSHFQCPQCRNISKWKFLRPNRLVGNMVEITGRLAATKMSPVSKKQCEKHQEPMKLFCQVDAKEICLVCRESVEHRTHTVIPVEESTSEFKVQLSNHLQTLRKEVATIIQTKSEDTEKAEKLQNEIKRKGRMLTSEFEILRQILADQESELKGRLENMERLIIQRTNERTSKLNEKLSSLQALIIDIEQNGHIYEEPKSVADRHSQNLQLCDPRQKPSRDSTMPARFFALKTFNVPVTLDHRTANPNLMLFGNRKKVRYEKYAMDLLNYPERFDMKPCVLGTTGYRSGKQYWEVEVGGGIYWSVGVAIQSVRRKGAFRIEPYVGIWAIGLLGVNADRYYAFTSYNTLLHPRDRPVVIGVFLNCEENRVSFFNAESFEHLYTFHDVRSPDKIFPFFCVGAMGTELRVVV